MKVIRKKQNNKTQCYIEEWDGKHAKSIIACELNWMKNYKNCLILFWVKIMLKLKYCWSFVVQEIDMITECKTF